jgi:hypothetical protein
MLPQTTNNRTRQQSDRYHQFPHPANCFIDGSWSFCCCFVVISCYLLLFVVVVCVCLSSVSFLLQLSGKMVCTISLLYLVMLASCCWLGKSYNVSSSDWLDTTARRSLAEACNKNAGTNEGYAKYFAAMRSIYQNSLDHTCLAQHTKCGWPSTTTANNLPLFVLSIGLEGAGHHLWTELLEQPVFDCVWINGRHYQRDIGDGVPRTTPMHLAAGFKEQFEMRKQTGKPPCRRIYDAEDSFPTGAIRKSGRVFMRPDLVNLEMLNGIIFNVKYLIIARNITVRNECLYLVRQCIVKYGVYFL